MFKTIVKFKKSIAMLLLAAIISGLVYTPTRLFAIDAFYRVTMSRSEWRLYFADARAKYQIPIAEKKGKQLGEACFTFKETIASLVDLRDFTEPKALTYRDAYNLAAANSQESVVVDGRLFTLDGLREEIEFLFESVVEQEADIALFNERLAVAQSQRKELALAVARAERVVDRIRFERTLAATSDSTSRIDDLIAEVNAVTEVNKRIHVDQFVSPKQLYDREKAMKRTPEASSTASSAAFDAFMKGGATVASAK